MFSGIVEVRARLLRIVPRDKAVEFHLERPDALCDIAVGDSICVDGVCLTVDSFTESSMAFVLGAETLAVTGWGETAQVGIELNVERSLAVTDRLHGHIVTGHVDARGEVVETVTEGVNIRLRIRYPESLRPYIWKKGSIAVNGVSLTINDAVGNEFAVGLIPETWRRTNLARLKAGDAVNLEVDNMARGLVHNLRHGFFKESGIELHP